MKKAKKATAGLVLTMALLTMGGAVYAESFSGTVPKFGGNLFTPTRSASGATQQVNVTYSEGNHNVYATVTDAAHNNMGDEEVFCTIGQWVNVKSGATKNQDIAMMLESSVTQTATTKVNFNVNW